MLDFTDRAILVTGSTRGIGRAVLGVKDKIQPGEYFLLVYGDTLTAENIFSKVVTSSGSAKGWSSNTTSMPIGWPL